MQLKLQNFVYKNGKYIKIAVLVTTVLGFSVGIFLILSYVLIFPNKQYILDRQNDTFIHDKRIPVGLVLGAGITKSGKPFRELQARLDMAADELAKGNIDQLILSGDNRFSGYNEPDAMKKYLVDTRHVPEAVLHPDYAGRSTYESCERAAKVFSQNKIIIISAQSHLPRAIYLCRHFGIEAFGIASGVEANNSRRRELVARAKAVFNVYILGERTVLGPTIRL